MGDIQQHLHSWGKPKGLWYNPCWKVVPWSTVRSGEREEKEAFDNEVEDQKQKKKNKKLVERAKKKNSTVAGPSTETDENVQMILA